jgi:hypothetical protein
MEQANPCAGCAQSFPAGTSSPFSVIRLSIDTLVLAHPSRDWRILR